MKTLENLFLPYDLAAQMKEKGFNEPCLAFWDDGDDEPATLRPAVSEQGVLTGILISGFVPGLMYAQATDWLRETHGITVYVHPMGASKLFKGCIETSTSLTFCQRNTHREALTEAIREALKLIP